MSELLGDPVLGKATRKTDQKVDLHYSKSDIVTAFLLTMISEE